MHAQHYCPEPRSDDILSEILQDLRLARASYGRSEFTAPWGVRIPYKEGVRFHFVVEGTCWMLTECQPPLSLEAGDVVLLPHGTSHVIADDPRREPLPLAEVGPRLVGNSTYHLTAGGGGQRALLVCCTIGFEGPTAHPLLEQLPYVLLVRKSDRQERSLPMLLNLMRDEVESQRVGSATIMARLADIVMTQIVRSWLENRSDRPVGLARGGQGSADRAGARQNSSTAGRSVDGRRARGRSRPVSLLVRRSLHGATRRVAGPLSPAVAHASCGRVAQEREHDRRRSRRSPRVCIRRGVQSRLQAVHGCYASRRALQLHIIAAGTERDWNPDAFVTIVARIRASDFSRTP